MENSGSRFSTKTPFWYENLPGRSTQIDEGKNSAYLAEDLNEVNERYLEVSRTSSVLRGGFFLMGSIVLVLLCSFFSLTREIFLTSPRSLFVISVLLVMQASLLFYALFIIWLDCHIPRDLPVRFYRKEKKVIVYDFSLSLNPFVQRRSAIKIFDWEVIEADLTKQAGFNGKAYMVRYALVLVVCKPGTTEVVDRITLKGNDMTIKVLQAMWAYVRRYMAEGATNLPVEKPRLQGISFLRSLFTYMPYFDPSAEGADYRSRMEAIDVILAFFMMWMFWVWLPMGLCHYIAMKCAPEPQWPAELQ